DRQYLAINILEAPLLALILGFCTKYLIGPDSSIYLFSENVNIPAYLFMGVVVAMFIGLNVSAEEIIKDRKLLKRESFLNLSRFSFLNSKVFVLFIISALQTLSFVLIGNYILEIKGLTLSYWLILFSVASFSNMLGLNISSGLNSVVAIYVLIPLILVPHLLFSGVIVSYDKLHPSMASKEFVPRVGDMMVTRWGYEALAVNQFKNNRYESVFFEDEMAMSQSSYYSSTLIPELIKINESCLWELKKRETQKFNKDWKLLRAGIKQFNQEHPDLFSPAILNDEELQFSDSTYQSIKNGLTEARQRLNSEYNYYSRLKDEKTTALIERLGSVEKVVELQQNYHNEALADWLLERKDVTQIEFAEDKFIQKKNPVFKAPTGKWGRSHFYASEKQLGPISISTPIFNCLVMWLGILGLYVMLYLDVLRRIIHYFDTFRLRQLNKRLQRLGT
ncbi:MAG TPA: ABC transporter permease, partial [Marinilabiliaceae bacterium]|nr:ABC transporter permease [Marinilabiliaceae bacterium]